MFAVTRSVPQFCHCIAATSKGIVIWVFLHSSCFTNFCCWCRKLPSKNEGIWEESKGIQCCCIVCLFLLIIGEKLAKTVCCWISRSSKAVFRYSRVGFGVMTLLLERRLKQTKKLWRLLRKSESKKRRTTCVIITSTYVLPKWRRGFFTSCS